jgi:hypothetical protein
MINFLHMALQKSCGSRLQRISIYYAWVFFVLTIVFGVILRLYGSINAPVQVFSDFNSHRSAAALLLKGDIGNYMVQKGPGYAPWLALGFLFTGGSKGGSKYHNWLVWNTLVLYPLCSLGLFFAAREVVGRRMVSVFPVFLMALLPSYVHIVRLTAWENINFLVVSLTLIAILYGLRKSDWSAAILGGILYGVALLIKPLFLALTPIFCLAFFIRVRPEFPFVQFDFGKLGRNCLLGLIFGLTVVATIAPWSIYVSKRLGKPVPIAAYAGLAFYVGNQPYGDARYGLGQRRAQYMIPNYDHLAPWRYNYEQNVRYSMWYLRHHPQSLIRDFKTNFKAQFGYTGLIRRYIERKSETPPISPSVEKLESFVTLGIIGLGILGLVSTGGSVSSQASWVVRLIWFFGFIVMPFVLIRGDERHRMAIMPVFGIMAAMYIGAVYNQRRGLLGIFMVPLSGLWKTVLTLKASLISLIDRVIRRPSSFFVMIVVGALGIYGVVNYSGYIRLSPDDLAGGKVSVIRKGELANPNPVIGQPGLGKFKESYEAIFKVKNSQHRHYRVEAIYAAARPIPLDMYVNNKLALERLFTEGTGGSYNYFAIKRPLGLIELQEGMNTIALTQAQDQLLLEKGFPHGTLTLPTAEEIITAGGIKNTRLDLLRSDAGGFEIMIIQESSDQPVAVITPITKLTWPLPRGERFFVDFKYRIKGDLKVDMVLKNFDRRGRPLRSQSQRWFLPRENPHKAFKMNRWAYYSQIVWYVKGNGTFMVERSPTIRMATNFPGERYLGPYIEEIRLYPAD